MHASTGDFIQAGDRMETRCRKCRRTVIIPPMLIERSFPRSIPLDHARRRMKCAQCGAKMPTITIYVHEQPGADPIHFGGWTGSRPTSAIEAKRDPPSS